MKTVPLARSLNLPPRARNPATSCWTGSSGSIFARRERDATIGSTLFLEARERTRRAGPAWLLPAAGCWHGAGQDSTWNIAGAGDELIRVPQDGQDGGPCSSTTSSDVFPRLGPGWSGFRRPIGEGRPPPSPPRCERPRPIPEFLARRFPVATPSSAAPCWAPSTPRLAVERSAAARFDPPPRGPRSRRRRALGFKSSAPISVAAWARSLHRVGSRARSRGGGLKEIHDLHADRA